MEIIIPKAQLKQETLEKAAAHHFNTEELVEGVNIQYSMQSAFIKGAKWQAERMYSEEGIINQASAIEKTQEELNVKKEIQ